MSINFSHVDDFDAQEWLMKIEHVIEELGSSGSCDLSFLYSLQEQLEEKGFLTEPQRDAVTRTMERFNIDY